MIPEVDWAALAAAPGPLILHATPTHVPDAAKALIEHGLSDQTLVAVTAQGTTCAQRTVETTLASLIDGVPVDANDPHGPMTGALVLLAGVLAAVAMTVASGSIRYCRTKAEGMPGGATPDCSSVTSA